MPHVEGTPVLGVVGVGSLGFHHARILRDLPGVVMGGIHDVDPERSAFVSRELGLEAHPTLDALLERVDAVVVAVPTVAHEEVATAALERDVHVFIEKPLAASLESADRIVELGRRRALVIQTGHVERFNAAVRAAERYLDRPLFIESHRLAPFVARGTDVAVVLDLMIHDVDLVQALVGRPVRDLQASGVPVLTPNVDIANARITFDGGAVANLTASRVSLEKMRKLRIFQPSGYLSLDLATGTGSFLRLKRELPVLGPDAPAMKAGVELADIVEHIPLKGDSEEPLRMELLNFRDAVGGTREPLVSGSDGRAALEIALSIQQRIERHVADTSPP